MPENSREKFVRLANSRANKVIDALRTVGNLSNKSNYTYSDKDVELMFSALSKALKEAQGRFKTAKLHSDPKFRLE